VSNGYLVNLDGLADFFIGGEGHDIECRSASRELSGDGLRHMVLNQVLPLALKLQGSEAIHATAVMTAAGACAFVGAAGSGKSTLAAKFLAAGYPTLCDDCLVLAVGDGIQACPGYPGVRLCDDAFAVFAGVPRPDPSSSRPRDKQRWRTPRAAAEFATAPQPLARVYLLDRSVRDADRVETVSTRDAFMALVRSTIRLDVTDRSMLRRETRVLEQVARTVPVRRLRLGHGLRSSAAVDTVLRDLEL
jgi:hypothetical protein